MHVVFEQALAKHCAPALAGIKPANLVSFYKNQIPDIHHVIKQYSQVLGQRNICIKVLYENEKRILLIVYRIEKLRMQLFNHDSNKERYFHSIDYPKEYSIEKYLICLSGRIENEDHFPHEIGLFLGYPLKDVIEFQKNKGKNYLMCKYWKVYEDLQEAQRKFTQYDKCTYAVISRVKKGISIAQLFCAA